MIDTATAIETVEKNGLKGYVIFDPEPTSPMDPEYQDGILSTIYHTHPRYELGERVEDHNEALYKIMRDNDLKAVCEYCADELEWTGYAWENTVVDIDEPEPDECKSEKSPVIQHPGIATITYKLHKPMLIVEENICRTCNESIHYGVEKRSGYGDRAVWMDDLPNQQGTCFKAINYAHEPKQKGVYIFPLYAYEHGGITISMGGFSCPWDSGQVGIVTTTAKRLQEVIGEELTEREAVKLLEAEIKNYAQYLEGMVYAYEIQTEDGDYVSSCGGYYDEADCKSEMLAEMED